ncbi:MAG TPA: RsmD family RNA methyltransferase, partial [Polyangiaceae bacterium LLY-WYZ-14_1]|nr:RsmD family RNA methyltransferase [Polyangiaceae bacterium LLY-WYZ-14_1]
AGVVRDLGARGEAVVSTPDAGVVLVPGAFPGERVQVRLDGRRRGVATGTLSAVLEPSPERRTPPCPLAADGRCGGCPWMALTLEAQRREKQRRVAGAAGLDPASVPLVAGPSPWAYRRRARLRFVGPDRSPGPRLGFHRPRSQGVVDVATCPVLVAPLDALLPVLRASLLPRLRGRGELHLGLGEGRRPVLLARTPDPQPPEAYRALEALVAADGGEAAAGAPLAGAVFEVDGIRTTVGDPREVVSSGDPAGSSEDLRTAPGGFAQAQEAVNEALVARVVAAAEPEGARVLELYAGHGNLTVALARTAAELVAAERDPEAVAATRENLARQGLGDGRRPQIRVADAVDAVRSGSNGRCVSGLSQIRVADAVDAVRARTPGTVDVVVLDPPRRGAGPEVIAAVAELAPARVVLVSCEPVTLARDLRGLLARGYDVDQAVAFDMFPQTPHVEGMVRLRRGGRG